MRIQHNIMAMNAYRNYTGNVSAMQKNLEKLSSGYKINRAGDDAAGLAISEKMRAQITGLEAAQKNAKDGISLVQTAEGALTEVHDMLNRMVQLASQSANGTFDNEVDRTQMQKEINQLRSEIDRIADSSNFNGIKLLDGKMGLNEDAFEIGGALQAVSAADMTIANGAKIAATTTATSISPTIRGSKTILHESGKAAQAGTFTIDMSQLTGNVKSAGAKFVLKVGNAAIASVTTSTVGKLAPSALAAKFVSKINTNKGIRVNSTGAVEKGNATGLGVGDLFYSVSSASGKLIFKTDKVAIKTGAYADSKVETFTTPNVPNSKVDAGALVSPNFAIAVSVGAASKASVANGTKVGNYQNVQATNIVGPAGPAITRLASTKLQLDMSKLEDGSRLNIAGKDYTFAIGANSAHKDKTDIIDLTAYDLETVQGASGQDAVDIMAIITADLSANANFSFGHAGTAGTPNYGYLSVFERGDPTNTANPSAITDQDILKKLETPEGFQSLFELKKPAGADKMGIALKVTNAEVKDGDGLTIDGTRYVFTKDAMADPADGKTKYVQFTPKGNNAFANLKAKLGEAGYTFGQATVTENGVSVTKDIIYSPASAGANALPKISGKGLTLQIGDTADPYNQLNVSLSDTHCSTLGIDASNLSIADQSSATKAIDTLKKAINQVSDLRGTLGATQNRLDHTINNLSVMQENIQDAEATIRDTDIASEMMAYTKNNILIQSAQAMLAQANQVPQGVLQLLQ